MPSNIFATTGTNVSILFIDATNKGDVILIEQQARGPEGCEFVAVECEESRLRLRMRLRMRLRLRLSGALNLEGSKEKKLV